MRQLAVPARFVALGAILALVVGLVLGVSSSSEAGNRPKPPRTFELTYAWTLTDVNQITSGWPTATLILNGDGSIDLFSPSTGEFHYDVGTYIEGRHGRTIEFHLLNNTVYTGTLQTDGWYDGTMISGAPTTLGLTGVWTGRFVP